VRERVGDGLAIRVWTPIASDRVEGFLASDTFDLSVNGTGSGQDGIRGNEAVRSSRFLRRVAKQFIQAQRASRVGSNQSLDPHWIREWLLKRRRSKFPKVCFSPKQASNQGA
jgi:hypothetical protein